MTVTINGTTGITSPEVVLDNAAADGGQVVLKSSGYSNWNWDNYSGRLRAYYNATEYFTIDTSGNVGIGTTSPTNTAGYQTIEVNGSSGGIVRASYSTTVKGYYFANSAGVTLGSESNDALMFRTNATERARFDTSGKFFVGGTASDIGYGTKLGVTNNASSNPTAAIQNARNVSGDSCAYFILGPNTSDTSSFFMQMFNSSQDKVYIYGNGSFANRTGTYGTISDASMKENIVDATPKLDDINKLRVRNFNFIDDENKEKNIGFIAQEVEQVFPALVFENGKTGKKEVKTSVFVPILIKAIQELNAKVDSLQETVTAQAAKIEALEAKNA